MPVKAPCPVSQLGAGTHICVDRSWTTFGLHFSVDYPLNDLWELDVATRKGSELEQRGTRPCARTMTHGMARFLETCEQNLEPFLCLAMKATCLELATMFLPGLNMPDSLHEHSASTPSRREASAPLQIGIIVALLD